ncbi:hypothetical protein M2262_002456 [Pseudomonas sp. BIGb0408]|uniref:Uncharacterized protein n=1 Tax=Phytopseudomonas flavescens TaxID=29435 RepID=A0A7Y9XKF3_9GAMM|nr:MULTISPECIES: hypothetical protein [Pseudomonas]MCW2292406.1 hypothetical protein [Pseudomonas sp. BIGb0408]NYH73023.1 hypothetical protein [Pseudomonas flavescens]
MSNRLDEMQDRSYPVQENMRIQKQYWGIERIGGWILLIIVTLTLFGLFSDGMLSTTTARGVDNTLHVEYERFMRNGATSNLIIDASGLQGLGRIEITGEMLEGSTLESIHPQPKSASTLEKTGISLQVLGDQSGHVRLHLALRADGTGLYRSRIMANGKAIDFWQFIYP